MSSAPTVIYLHIGLHKTGTTYLQNVFRANQRTLAEQGIYYPDALGPMTHTLAAWDLHGVRPRGTGDKRIGGSWDSLADAVNTSGMPTALISAERLSLSTLRQAKKALDSLPASEVHVIVTVRDLARVLVSSWQETIKNGATWTWQEFADGVKDKDRSATNPARSFWLQHDVVKICRNWETVIPTDRLHVVTVPPSGASPDDLLARFASVVGFDPATLTEPPVWTNETVGAVATEAIRRVNERLGDKLNKRQHAHVVKTGLVRVLAERTEATRFVLPEEELPWLAQRSDQMVAALLARGYPVGGDLDELRVMDARPGRRPDSVSDAELVEVAFDALGWLTELHANLWWRHRKADVETVPGGGGVASKARSALFKSQRMGARLADRNALAAKALAAVLRGRDRARSKAK